MKVPLSRLEKLLLVALRERGSARADELVDGERFRALVEVMNAASWLESKGLVRIVKEEREYCSLTDTGRAYLAEGLPERRIAGLGREVPLEEIQKRLGRDEGKVGVGWCIRHRWGKVDRERGVLVLDGYSEKELPEEGLMKQLESGPQPVSEDMRKTADVLKKRGILDVDVRTTYTIELTEQGAAASRDVEVPEEEITQITPEILKDGSWKRASIRPYHIHDYVPTASGGKLAPLTVVAEEVRRIFLSMGFEEIEGEYIVPCLWNMDILFIPQDHPARDLQDTFYMKKPSRMKAERELAEKVREVHENGGATGSRGWRYTWDLGKAEQCVLRTHTTVNTIRYIVENPKVPARVFSIGRVFRNESVSYKHLPEFHQIEGIAVEEDASLSMLFGLLKTFYSKMGFEDIRVRPSYFPYTEPSLEIDVLFRGRWMEMGGAGIFRPEVTEPYGIDAPVLAWGLGLERLTMMVYGIDDVRKLYYNDLEQLKGMFPGRWRDDGEMQGLTD